MQIRSFQTLTFHTTTYHSPSRPSNQPDLEGVHNTAITMNNVSQDFDFWNTEDCVLTLNYAWYHAIGCAVLLLYLYVAGQTQHFEAGHNFGLFAMLADYGVMYLVKGTRTLAVVSSGEEDVDDLYGIGTFLFFGWFDY